MAKGTNTKNLVNTGRVQLITEWTGTANKSNNTSLIKVDVYLYFAGAIYSTAQKSGSITIGGTKYNYNYAIGNHPNGAKVKIGTASRTVEHNTIGELSVAISTTNTLAVTYAGVYISTGATSFTARMDNIPRNSTIGTVSNFTSPTNSPSVQIIAADASFTHIIDFRMNNKTLFSREGLKGGTHNLALTEAEQDLILKHMIRTPSSTFTIVLGTYNSAGVWTGTAQQKNATVTVDSNIVPVISNIQWFDFVWADPTTGDPYVDVSQLRITTEAFASKFALINLIEVEYNGFTYRGTEVDTAVITDVAPYNTITVTATDSRGRKTVKTKSVYARQMGYPRIGTKAYRSNANGVADTSGKYLRVIADHDTNGSGSGNGWWIQWRKGGTTTWTTLDSGGEPSVQFQQTYNLNLSTDSSYEVRTIVDNYLYRETSIINIPTEFVTFDVRANGKGIAFGKVSEKDAFEVAFPSEFNGRMSVKTSTDNASNNNLIFFNRSDNTLLAALNYDKTSNNFRLHRYDANGTWKTDFNFGVNGIFTDRKCYIQVAVGTSNTQNTAMTVPVAWNSTSSLPWRTTLFNRNNAFTAQNGTTYVANRDMDVRITLQTTTFNHSVQTDISKNIMVNGSVKTFSYSRVLGSYANDNVSTLVSLKAGDGISCSFTGAAAITFTLFWSTTLTIEEL